MCNPRYLGNLYIKEFPDPYKWWNFLAEIKNQLNETTLMIRSYFMDFENGIVKIDEEAFSPKYSFEMFRHSSFIRIKLVHLITMVKKLSQLIITRFMFKAGALSMQAIFSLVINL